MPKHPIVHFEIGCKDMPSTTGFYAKLFEWHINPANQITDAGLAGHFVSLGHEPHQYTMIYVQVDDVAAAIAKAVELGGKQVVPPVNIPTGTFGWINDPGGNMIGLWKPAA